MSNPPCQYLSTCHPRNLSPFLYVTICVHSYQTKEENVYPHYNQYTDCCHLIMLYSLLLLTQGSFRGNLLTDDFWQNLFSYTGWDLMKKVSPNIVVGELICWMTLLSEVGVITLMVEDV